MQLEKVSSKEKREYNCKREQLRKFLKKSEDPQWQEKQNKKARELYAKNPEPRLSDTKKWQKNNRLKVNATKRNYHAKHRKKINAQVRARRKLKQLDSIKQKDEIQN